MRDLGDCSARVLGRAGTGLSHHALMVGSSLVALVAALGPVAAQTIPARSPSTLDAFGVPLTAAQFDTPEYRADWGLARINAATAYARGFTGQGVMVAVVDSGIDPNHPEFHDAISPLSRNFILFSPNHPLIDTDTSANHGTHVSGTIGARRDGYGMMGVAFDSTILSLPTRYNSIELADAIDYAAASGARVLNGSYGPNYSKPRDQNGNPNPYYYQLTSQSYYQPYVDLEHEAIVNAAKNDVLMVFAAGNDGTYQPKLAHDPEGNALLPFIKPSNSSGNVYHFVDKDGTNITNTVDYSDTSGYIIAVVATDRGNKIADFSNGRVPGCGVARR
ncbi:S8 family peptidase [Methylobacterium sp. NPDC080182]|uniref:S8 family peptidase n=1 Tax=Methylobacterium sp. NPDC080182 TaxID=3390590 RepID=UPI003D03321C